MRRDFRLYELSDDEFEKLIVQICTRWLGQGVTPFAPGKDGGRDGKFHGTANCFPSAKAPLGGHFVLQAKHVAAPDKSCSDKDFQRTLKGEHPKIRRLIKEKICDHYVVFTNRKYTGGADEKLTNELLKLGLKSAHIIGVERLHLALEEYGDLRDGLPNRFDQTPFRFDAEDLIDVIGAVHDYTFQESSAGFDSARDFERLKIKDEKNKINGLTLDYYNQVIVSNSMLHFGRVEKFLKNPRNKKIANLYHDAADELKQKIFLKRHLFSSFDDVFGFLYEQIQRERSALKGKRRMVTILLHYMYCNCDIGSKDLASEGIVLC